jgi:hypothetical protein
MIIMAGMYIITKMMIYILRNDPDCYKLGIVINKLLAATTVIVAIGCILLATLSFIDMLDVPTLEQTIFK